MDATGARQLRTRLDDQEHWRRADAVVRGDQPRVDPDAADLEELGDGIRLYGTREESRRVVGGIPGIVIERLTKQLVDGWWQTAYEVERFEALVSATSHVAESGDALD
jgi:hypothetical protein